MINNRHTTPDPRQPIADTFSPIGKRMPYRTPAGFFEQQPQVLRSTIHNVAAKRQRLVRWAYVAAVAVILLLLYPISRIVNSAEEVAPVYSGTEDADEWLNFANADIFLDAEVW